MPQDKNAPIEHRDGKQVDDNIDDLGRPVNAPEPGTEDKPPHPDAPDDADAPGSEAEGRA